MRLRIAAILVSSFLVASVDAQIGLRPDFFIEQTAPTNANFEVYSQKSGLPRRASLANLKKPLSPFITDTVDYIPAATGNLTDLASFVWDTTGLLWYIDGEGDAVSFDGGAVSDGDYGDITVSGTGTVWSIDAGVVGPTELASTAVTPGSYTLTGLTVDADGRLTAASNGTIGSGTNGDMAVWSGANTLTSQTDAKFIYDNNLAYGQGTALRSAYWSNDTTLAPTLIEYSSTLYDADAITGAFGLPTGTTAERSTATLGRIRANSTLGDVEFGNGTLFRSVVESMANTFTPGELGYYNSAGVLTDTSIAAILSMGSGTTGSGVSGRVAYWNGTSSLTGHANFLWDGTDLSVGTTSSSYTLSVGTGGVYVTPQSAAVTGVEGAGYWDSDAPKGMWWHDGTTFRATVWGDAPSWAAETVPVSDGAKLVRYANFQWSEGDSDGLIIGGSDGGANGLNVRRIGGTGNVATFESSAGVDLINIENTGMIDFEQGISSAIGLQWGTSGQNYVGASGTGTRMNFSNSGGNKAIMFNVSGVGDMACIGGNQLGSVPTQVGIFSALFAGHLGSVTTIFRGGDAGGAGSVGGPTIVRGGTSFSANSNGGNLTLRGGGHNSSWFAGGGTPGDVIIEVFNDFPDSASHVAGYNTPVEVMRWNQGSRYQWVHKQRMAVPAGVAITEELVMHVDTIKMSTKAYGEMYIDDASVQTLTFAGGSTTPAQEDGWSSGDLQAFTRSNGRLTYTGTETRKFLITIGVSFSFGEGSTDVEGWVYKGGSEVTGSGFQRRIGTGGDVGNFGTTCVVELATNEYIEIFFAPGAHTGDDDLIIEHANVSVIKL